MAWPGSISRNCSQDLSGFWVLDVTLECDKQTKVVSVHTAHWSLKYLAMNGFITPPKHMSNQSFGFKTKEEYEHFSDRKNFESASEWFKALIPFSVAHHQFGEPLQDFLARVETL